MNKTKEDKNRQCVHIQYVYRSNCQWRGVGVGEESV